MLNQRALRRLTQESGEADSQRAISLPRLQIGYNPSVNLSARNNGSLVFATKDQKYFNNVRLENIALRLDLLDNIFEDLLDVELRYDFTRYPHVVPQTLQKSAKGILVKRSKRELFKIALLHAHELITSVQADRNLFLVFKVFARPLYQQPEIEIGWTAVPFFSFNYHLYQGRFTLPVFDFRLTFEQLVRQPFSAANFVVGLNLYFRIGLQSQELFRKPINQHDLKLYQMHPYFEFLNQ